MQNANTESVKALNEQEIAKLVTSGLTQEQVQKINDCKMQWYTTDGSNFYSWAIFELQNKLVFTQNKVRPGQGKPNCKWAGGTFAFVDTRGEGMDLYNINSRYARFIKAFNTIIKGFRNISEADAQRAAIMLLQVHGNYASFHLAIEYIEEIGVFITEAKAISVAAVSDTHSKYFFEVTAAVTHKDGKFISMKSMNDLPVVGKDFVCRDKDIDVPHLVFNRHDVLAMLDPLGKDDLNLLIKNEEIKEKLNFNKSHRFPVLCYLKGLSENELNRDGTLIKKMPKIVGKIDVSKLKVNPKAKKHFAKQEY